MAERAGSDPLRGKDTHGSSDRRIRLSGVPHSALPGATDLTNGMETLDETRAKESVQDVQKKLKDQWDKAQGSTVQSVLAKLNPIIGGWANYFRTAVAKEIFSKLDSWMFYQADRYARGMHPNKSSDWRHRNYWGRLQLDRLDPWVFGDKQTGGHLLKLSWFPLERHVLVKATASPDDPRLADYWTKRQAAKARDLTPSKQKLAKRQQGRCRQCGEALFNDEDLQVHHRLSRSQGGQESYSNLVLVHVLCHQQIHATTERAMSDCRKSHDRELLREESINTRRSKRQEKKEPCCS